MQREAVVGIEGRMMSWGTAAEQTLQKTAANDGDERRRVQQTLSQTQAAAEPATQSKASRSRQISWRKARACYREKAALAQHLVAEMTVLALWG